MATDDPAVAIVEGQQGLTRIDSGLAESTHRQGDSAVLVDDHFGR
ncbi:hypothetical protein [Streptomyces malaysiensis]|nr:hypothetical protein [Streptomyces malaysiensis]